MKADNCGIKFVLSRLITTMLVVATFTLATLGIPFINDAIATPQPTFAAVKTQDKMADEQNRAQDDQNNPDGVEFGFEDEARILGTDDTLDKLKGIFGGGSKDQSSAGAASRKSAKTSTENPEED